MKNNFARGILLSGTAIALTMVVSSSAAWAGDSDPLLQLLQQKGIITSAELARVESGPASGQRDRLVDLLRSKGILSNSDAASLATTAPSQASIAAQMQPTGFQAPTSGPVQPRVRVAAAHRPPVAHVLEVTDDGSEAGLIYATDRSNDQNPLSFRIGGVSFYPGGDIRATTIIRARNTGSGLGTNFGAIPYSNTIQGHRSETRITGQGTTFDLGAVTDIGPVHVAGFLEVDFNGNAAANTFVNSNSYTPRSRLAYVDATWGNWELSAGQMYSWLTPNRVGVGSAPANVFLTNNVDDNFNVGLTWTRAAQVRIVYHPDEHWALGIGIENPDQYVGVGEVIFPFAFNAALSSQFDAGNQTTVPNMLPDFTGKIAYDSDMDGHAIHAELTGLMTTIDETVVPIGGTNFTHQHAFGGGVGVNLNLELFRDFHLIGNGFYSDGGGRYVGALGPDTVVMPIDLGGGEFTIRPVLVRSASALVGFEYLLCPETVLSAYYGGAYFARTAFPDVTSPLLVKPIIGFGGINSPNSANRYIQEATVDLNQTIWSDPSYGSVQFAGQFSYLERSPWFYALGAPVFAKTWMGFGELRFVFP